MTRTLTARFASTCAACGDSIVPGTLIVGGKGTPYVHTDCTAPVFVGTPARRGRPATGSTYTRFSSGAEVFTNRRGRCEDAPCCGCCS
jgi:hypothetical protein